MNENAFLMQLDTILSQQPYKIIYKGCFRLKEKSTSLVLQLVKLLMPPQKVTGIEIEI